MKLQAGEVLMNKTYQYLAPCLNEYGEKFMKLLNGAFKVAIGIGDMVLVEQGIRYEQHLFILVDMNATPLFSKLLLEYSRKHNSYEDDYVYDNVTHGQFHMIVVRIPESAFKSQDLFKKSQYSKMYTRKDVERYFKDNDVKSVLIQDGNYLIKHTDNINNMFGTNIRPSEVEGEHDMPIDRNEEIFNNELKKE